MHSSEICSSWFLSDNKSENLIVIQKRLMEIDQLKLFVVALQSALKNITGNVIFINYYAILSK